MSSVQGIANLSLSKVSSLVFAPQEVCSETLSWSFHPRPSRLLVPLPLCAVGP